MTRRALVILVCSSFLVACECGEFIPTTNAEHNQMLGTLGFNTELGARTDPLGQPVADDYHPLGKRFSVFHPKAELYVGGQTNAASGLKENLFDDASQAYARLALTGKQDTSWAGATFKNGVAGDFDGDGLDELFLVYYVDTSHRLRFIMLDVDGVTMKEGELDPAVESTGLDNQLQPSLAAGDLDGDGREEVAIGFSRFYLVDRLEAEPAVSVKTHADQSQGNAYVAMGNLDWDGADELVVSYTITKGAVKTGRYAIYDGNFVTPTQADALAPIDSNSVAHPMLEGQVAIGNIDRDRLGEIIFGGWEGSSRVLFTLEYGRPTDTPLYAWTRYHVIGFELVYGLPYSLLTLDLDGDGIKEVFFGTTAYKLTTAALAPIDIGLRLPIIGRPAPTRVAAGDVDGDGRDDLVYALQGVVYALGLNSLDVWAIKASWAGALTPANSVIIMPANVDKDSAIVRYDGDYELLFTAPQLEAVLASPPYKDGIGQNVDATASTFGKTSGQTVEHETSLGFSTSFSVGYEADFAFFGSAEFSMEVEQSLDFISGSSATITRDHSFTTGPGEDKVVFTTVPFDVYYYTIISSPQEADVGRTVTINVPREPQTQATTIAFYNSHNGGAQDVDESILIHRPGDLWSYPTREEKDRILASAKAAEPGYEPLWNGPLAIGEGGGYDTLGITKTEGSKRGAAMDVNVKFEFSATSPGGAKAGGSVGFHYGHSCTYSTEDGAFFQGTLGNIPARSYTAANLYKAGLFVYPQSVGGQKFLVMNYWTEH